MSELKLFETPDGRVFGGVPNENGPRALTFEARGEAAEFLRGAGYIVRVVVERIDGSGFTDNGRAVITAAMEAEARGESAREAAATVHFARAKERFDVLTEPARKAG